MNLAQLKTTLNAKQFQAISLKANENGLILAGAGSGKTRTLIHRIAYLCEYEDVLPQQILAVTFTNKAANEMKERLQNLLLRPIGAMWIGTFHSLAFRMLQVYHRQTALPFNLQIIDPSDQLRIIRRILAEMGLDEKIYVPQKIRHFINHQKDEGNHPSDIVAGDNFFVKKSLQIYEHYQQHCLANNLLDFAQILLQSYELLKDNKEVRQQYQKRFKHVLVDEFQDTNHIQYQWIKLLYANNNTIFCVGDDDQSIYGWRGAKIENIHLVQGDFSPVQLIQLEQNYRSTGHILQAANTLISHNSGRFAKTLWTKAGNGEKIDILQNSTDKAEVSQVIKYIKTYLDNNIKPNECAILYRTNVQSRLLEDQLITNHIPYEIYGGLRFFEREEVKDALAYLRLVLNSADDIAFLRIVNKPHRGIGRATLEKLLTYAQNNAQTLWQATQSNDLNTPRQSALKQFCQLIDQLRQRVQTKNLPQMLSDIIDHTGLISQYEKINAEIAKNKQQNLKELVSAAREFENNFKADESEVNLKQAFIDNAVLDSGERQKQNTLSVQLMTVHAAKGLEFPYVFIVGLEENLFPSQQAQDEDPLTLEERRLFYVAITRAMKKLHLSFATRRFLWGQEKTSKPSRFLGELPTKHLNIIKSTTAYQNNVQASNAQSSRSQYQNGDKVIHEKFGLGVVTNYEGSGENKRVEINFKDHGKKWLILAYAKIAKLS